MFKSPADKILAAMAAAPVLMWLGVGVALFLTH
jgi:hypothetical protein